MTCLGNVRASAVVEIKLVTCPLHKTVCTQSTQTWLTIYENSSTVNVQIL